MEAVARVVEHGRAEINKAVIGQEKVVDQCLLTLVCGGHALLEGVPGIAKTLLVKLLSRLLQLQFQRVQCTSDLMPADILGTNILNTATASFQLHRGPIFTEVLLVDEINRMPPRTQAALLEAMEERQVTIDGVRYALPAHFTVFATQNPIEFEGTYPLPEAQLDRFLMKVRVAYPALEHEVHMLRNHHEGFDPRDLDAMAIEPFPGGWLDEARAAARSVKVEPQLVTYVAQLVRKTRDWPSLALGASPRAAVALLQTAKATATLDGRDYLVPDDVKAAALPVLRHRVQLRPEAELEGLNADEVVTELLRTIEVPR